MTTMLEPAIVILNVWRDVRAFENALKACQMVSFCDIILRSIVDAVMDSDLRYAHLLEVVAELKHSQGPTLRERDLQKLAMATGDLGMAIINELDSFGFYREGVVLPYAYDGLMQASVVLHHIDRTINSVTLRSF